MAEPFKTVISTHTPFVTGADLVEYRDWRHVADMLKDDGTRPGGGEGTKGATISELDTADSAGYRAARVATGMIELACYRGGRYTRADLHRLMATITDEEGSGVVIAREMLKKLACDLMFWVLVQRRKPDADPKKVAGVPEALSTLEALRLGEAIFPFLEVSDAAATDIAPLDPNVDADSYVYEPLSTTASRFFGTRSRDLRS